MKWVGEVVISNFIICFYNQKNGQLLNAGKVGMQKTKSRGVCWRNGLFVTSSSWLFSIMMLLRALCRDLLIKMKREKKNDSSREIQLSVERTRKCQRNKQTRAFFLRNQQIQKEIIKIDFQFVIMHGREELSIWSEKHFQHERCYKNRNNNI